MKLTYFLLTALIGITITVHLAMNGKVGSVLNNARVANALFWCIGAIGALVIGATGWQRGALAPLRSANPALLIAGILGASLVFGIAWLIPRVGAGPLTLVMVAGQIAAGLLLSHFGWLGSPVEKITVTQIIGVLVMFGGVVLATAIR
jgi:bacterial/archaeal transporter family-2 protein